LGDEVGRRHAAGPRGRGREWIVLPGRGSAMIATPGTPVAPSLIVASPPRRNGGPVMAKKRTGGRAAQPKEVSLDAMREKREAEHPPTTASETSMRDGDSGKGERYWDAEDEVTTEQDVGDGP